MKSRMIKVECGECAQTTLACSSKTLSHESKNKEIKNEEIRKKY